MADLFRTLIVTAADAPVSRSIAEAFGPGGQNMWTTPLSASGSEPATHYISTGLIPEEFAYLMPTQYWEQGEDGAWLQTGSDPGNAAAVWQAASEQGVACTLAEVEAIFAAADVTPQEPFVAMGRLGLQIINPKDL